MDLPVLSFNYPRRWGVEMEVNSLDQRDFKTHPLIKSELPQGIEKMATMITEFLGEKTVVKGWHPTHNNDCWVLKPDSSCGIEICSPVQKGWLGLNATCKVADLIKSTKIPVDNRCSLHVHVDVDDCNRSTVAKILSYWIKCESVFLDSVPLHRKRNRYCQCIGMSDLFDHDSPLDDATILAKLGQQKYYTINCFHFYRSERNTIEARIAESDGCVDSLLLKNWVRLILHFVEMAIKAPAIENYNPNNPHSGFCWLDLEDVISFLGFSGEYQLSPGMEQVRNWFLARLNQNISKSGKCLPGVWSDTARKISKQQLDNIIDRLNLTDLDSYLNWSEAAVYSDNYKN